MKLHCIARIVTIGSSEMSTSLEIAQLCFSLQHGHYSNPAAPNLQHTRNWEQNDRCGNSTTQSQTPVMMDILMSETCWVHKKWNKIASDIKLVFYSSTITMIHGPINIRFCLMISTWSEFNLEVRHLWTRYHTANPFLWLVRCQPLPVRTERDVKGLKPHFPHTCLLCCSSTQFKSLVSN